MNDWFRNMDEKRRERVVLVVVTLFPAIIALILLVINPNYILELFRLEEPFVVEPYLPLGWVIVVVTTILLGTFSVSYWFLDKKPKPGCLLYLLKMVVFALFFLVLIATYLLVLFGPAVFQILRSEALRDLP